MKGHYDSVMIVDISFNKIIWDCRKYGSFLIAAHTSDIPPNLLDPSYCARFNPTSGPVSRVYSVVSTEEFSRKSLWLSKSGIEIWKFLTSYIRDLVGRSFSSLAVSYPLTPGAVALIGLPLAFPYPRARSHSPTRSHAHAPHVAHPSYPYHIFLHIIPLFSGATPSREKRVPRRQKSLMR